MYKVIEPTVSHFISPLCKLVKNQYLRASVASMRVSSHPAVPRGLHRVIRLLPLRLFAAFTFIFPAAPAAPSRVLNLNGFLHSKQTVNGQRSWILLKYFGATFHSASLAVVY